MTDRHAKDDTGNEILTDGAGEKDDVTGLNSGVGQRSLMKRTGASVATGPTTEGDTKSTVGTVTPDTVVDLGEEGLSAGDRIDPYIQEYFRDDVAVHVPAGEYEWGGQAFSRAAVRNAAVIGRGEVILDAVDGQYQNQIVAAEGTVAVKNFTVRGSVEASQNRLEATDGARVVVENWNFPDGSEDGSSGQAFYCPADHAGEVVIRNCYLRGFDEGGIDAGSPGRGEGGRVVVENCVTHNNNAAGIRIGGRNSTVRNCTVLNDAPAPVSVSGHRNQHGICIVNDERSKEMVIENVDVIHSSESLGGGPIRWSGNEPLSTGHMENVRVYNSNPDIAAIGDERDRAEGWTGNDITVAGDGDLEVPDWFTCVRVGSTFGVTNPTDDSVSNESADDDATGEPGDASDDETNAIDGLSNRVIVDGTCMDAVASYTFHVSGDVAVDEAISSEGSARWDETDDIVADGTVAGVVKKGIDGFRYSGEITAISVDGVVDLSIESMGL